MVDVTALLGGGTGHTQTGTEYKTWGHLNVNEGSGWLGLGNDCHNSGELLQLFFTRQGLGLGLGLGQSYNTQYYNKDIMRERCRDDVLALCRMTSSEEVVAIKVLC